MHASLLLLILAAASARVEDGPQALGARPAFERLKGLAGDWEETSRRGGGPLRVHYEVTPDGSVVIEIFDPGTVREMINVYHLDGPDRLLLTHYCALGNQPRMRLETSSLPGELRFSFAGGTNLNPERDRHLRWEVVRLLGDKWIESEYAYYQDGKKVGSNTLILRRTK